MEFQYELKENNLRVEVPKELDHYCAEQLRQELDLLIATYHLQNVIFDFKGTDFMDSSGIGVIIGRYRNVKFKGGCIFAVNLNERMGRIFHMAGLEKIVTVI